MPLLIFGAGGLLGFTIAGGIEDTGRLAKWAVIGGAAYIGAKALKVI